MVELKIQVQVPAPTCQLTGGLTQTVHIISAWVFFFFQIRIHLEIVHSSTLWKF